MRVAAAGFSGNRRTNTASRILALVTVLAFALQSFLTQTHIHPVAHASSFAKISVEILPGHSKAPLDKSPADCPICQAMAHSGVFLTPVATAIFLPVSVEYWALFFAASTAIGAVAPGWQSRAPPLR